MLATGNQGSRIYLYKKTNYFNATNEQRISMKYATHDFVRRLKPCNLIRKILMIVGMLVSPGMVYADALNMPEGVTPISHQIYDFHMLIFYIVLVVGIIVFGVMFYSVFAHRKSKGAIPATFHENTTVEIIWTAVPAIVLIAVAFPATKLLLAIEDTSASDMTIQATGYQWNWKYDYLDEKISFFSKLHPDHNKARQRNSGIDVNTIDNYLLEVDNPVVVPINKKIRILTTANDVIHSWWVPELAVKRDAIPGFINESWMLIEKEGTYRGQCTELCGKDHGFMPIVVVAKNESDYKQWVASKKQAAMQKTQQEAKNAVKMWTKDELMVLGKEKYDTNCGACHMPNGAGGGPFPSLIGSAAVKGPAAGHIGVVLNGKGTMMPKFASLLSDTDIAAIVTYERNAWGNDMGDIIKPSDVKAAR